MQQHPRQQRPELATAPYRARDLIVASGLIPTRITVGAPKFNPGYAIGGFVQELAPWGDLFRIRNREAFSQAYRARLDLLGLERIEARLHAISGEHGHRGLCLLCFEAVRDDGDPEAWCHRRVFADWWQERTGQEVREL